MSRTSLILGLLAGMACSIALSMAGPVAATPTHQPAPDHASRAETGVRVPARAGELKP